VWVIAFGTIAGVLFRPRKWPEAVWACLGALLLVISGWVSPAQAATAIAKGTDVYLFLTGMMLLSELARREGVFDWLASLAVRASKASRARLFTLVYMVGILVTVFLSNDATAVVLTPAVYAAVRRAQVKPLPYLFACAFIANAASFVLPISNPANLVVFGAMLPPLLPWFRNFLLASLMSIAATYVVLHWIFRKEVQGRILPAVEALRLSNAGLRAVYGILATGAILIFTSVCGSDLGWATCVAAILAVLIATRGEAKILRRIVSGVSWSVLPLVGGLFVLVEGLRQAGALHTVNDILQRCAEMSRAAGALTASFGIAGLSNIMNNLPSGLVAGDVLQAAFVPVHIRNSVLIGVDLGPNLSVAGSLATILWLIVLRREGEQVSSWEFLKVGALVMPPALFLSTLAAAFLSK
jgi:arsenical pump membrane protein